MQKKNAQSNGVVMIRDALPDKLASMHYYDKTWCDIKRMVFSPFFFYLINQRFYGMIDDMEVVEMI